MIFTLCSTHCTGRICSPLIRMRCTQWNQIACNLSLQTVVQLHNFLPTSCLAIVFKVNWPAHYLNVVYVYFFPHSGEDFVTDRKYVYCVVRPQLYVHSIEVRLCRASGSQSPASRRQNDTVACHCQHTTAAHVGYRGAPDARVLSLLQEFSPSYCTLRLKYIAPIADNFQTRRWHPSRLACCLLGAGKVLELLFLSTLWYKLPILSECTFHYRLNPSRWIMKQRT